MKIFAAALSCFAFFFLWLMRVCSIKRDAKAFAEICSFVREIKNALRYNLISFDEILLLCGREGFEYIKKDGGSISVEQSVSSELKTVFAGFCSKIGTTDYEGQLDICDEYIERLDCMRVKFEDESEKNIRLCTALNGMLVLCCVLLAV